MVRATFWSSIQALHPGQLSALVLYCSDCMLTLFHTGRFLDHRNPTGAQRAASARSGFLIVCCSDCTPASFPYASAFFANSHILIVSADQPPASPAAQQDYFLLCMRTRESVLFIGTQFSNLYTAVDTPAMGRVVSVVECAPASPYAYSSSIHRFPDERTHLSRLRLFQRHLRSLVWVWVWVWDGFTLTLLFAHAPLLLSPPSFHTLSLSPAFTSGCCSD
jgi:hypothetical protein